jgi:hypothetical protein
MRAASRTASRKSWRIPCLLRTWPTSSVWNKVQCVRAFSVSLSSMRLLAVAVTNRRVTDWSCSCE